MELDASDMSIKKAYIYGNSQVIAQYNGSPFSANKYFYLHDRLGSVRQVIDCQADVVAQYTYNPFGELLTSDESQAPSNCFKFTGQWYDDEIQQYYLRARQYDPYLSRFTGRDPILGQFGEPLTLHKYLYCGNNPINWTDPTGNWAVMLGASVSGNIAPLSAMVGEFGMMGYNMWLLAFMNMEMGFGGTAGSAFAFAHDPDQGLTKGWSYGDVQWLAGGLSLSNGSGFSLTGDIGISFEAKRVSDLGGGFEEFGGSVTWSPTMPLRGWGNWTSLLTGNIFCNATVGLSYSRGVGETGKPTGINLWTLSLGTGVPGWEAHVYKGKAWATEWWDNFP